MAEMKKIAPGQVIAGRYRVIRELGRGAVGSVHLVQHLHTDEQFALKVLHDPAAASPEKIARFRVEAKAPARIDSDHVVRITDADIAPELGGAPFFVMEYLRGKDLGAEIDARGHLSPEEVVLYMRQASRALDKAHALGIVHRDLKPENLFLTEREDGVPCIKLVDFGVAKLTGDATGIAQVFSRTQTGRIFGTPLFMSPEQATGKASLVGPSTDIWALGLVVNRLLTGNDYFEADTIAELIGMIAYDPIKPPSAYGYTFGPSYDAWFLRCCHREIGKRYRTAGEAVTALAAALLIEEGDALIDTVISSRRAGAEFGYRETMRAPPSDEDVSFGESSTMDSKVPPAPVLPALAPPPVPPTRPPAASLPFLPPIAPPPVPPAFGQPGFQPTATGASMAATSVEPDEGPPPSALRRYGPFAIAILGVSMLGLALGVSYLRPPEGPVPAASTTSAPAAPPSSPASGRVPPSLAPSSPNVVPSAPSLAPDNLPSGAPSAVRVGGSLKSKNPLDARH